MWAIYNIEEPDLAWSNDHGWVSGPEFDLFTDEERQTLNLPIGGEWRQVTVDALDLPDAHWALIHEIERTRQLSADLEAAKEALRVIQGMDSQIVSPANRQRYVEVGHIGTFARATLERLNNGK